MYKIIYKWLPVILISVILSGCNIVDTYYTATGKYIDEKIAQEVEAGFNIEQVRKAYFALEIRIELHHQPHFAVSTMIKNRFNQSYLTKEIEVDGKTAIITYNECDYFNDKNWNCGYTKSNKHEIQMEDGKLSFFENDKLLRLVLRRRLNLGF